jgi:quercetin dioxygenase-like cupin family protein
MKVHHIRPEAGAEGPSDYFIGRARVQPILGAEDAIDIVLVTFSPGARTYLHAHEVPQVLHCLSGRGVLATETERFDVGPRDIVHVPADELHWHGCVEGDEDFSHLSIRPLGETSWTKIDPLA